MALFTGMATDQAKKCDIDWEAMQIRAKVRGEEYWEKAMGVSADERRNSYGICADDTKQSYVERYVKDVCLLWVAVIDGEWHEKKYAKDHIKEEKYNEEWVSNFKSFSIKFLKMQS